MRVFRKKVLIVATVASHINTFHLPDIKFFKENGWEVHVVIGMDPEIRGEKNVLECDKFNILPFTRSPFKSGNLTAIKKLKNQILNEKYDIIHCHTPMGSVVTRLASIGARKKYETKVIYTCHGAHFYHGAPLINWLIYYPIERLLSPFTDCIITINREDYNRFSRKFKRSKIEYVPGVGFGNKFIPVSPKEKTELRKDLGYNDEDFILLFVGELCQRKNQDFLIESVNLLRSKIPDLRLLLVGTGALEATYRKKVSDLGLEGQVEFLGYRTDVDKLLNIADVYIAASHHEGLAVNILEALGSGLPVVVTEARGQSDLIHNEINGFTVKKGDLNSFADKIDYLFNNPKAAARCAEEASKSVEPYRINAVRSYIEDIYRRYMG